MRAGPKRLGSILRRGRGRACRHYKFFSQKDQKATIAKISISRSFKVKTLYLCTMGLNMVAIFLNKIK